MSAPNLITVNSTSYTIPVGYNAKIRSCVNGTGSVSINGSIVLKHASSGNGGEASVAQSFYVKAGAVIAYTGDARSLIELYLI